MPSFALTAHAAAPVEEVWKLLHDPSRFPEWWSGVETVRTGPSDVYTMWPENYPDFPMDQRLDATPAPGRVTISCLVSDLVFRWELRADDEETDIDVHVDIPELEAHRLSTQRELIRASINRLAELAGT
ncbi:SRPBCC family protein [Cellulomonas sp. McL0617]|uniref:SRPBCC family protein n=1 Tax=Cellulomonas sp. McL0617 TaxID=3415675 RepID=UPI003CFB9BC4